MTAATVRFHPKVAAVFPQMSFQALDIASIIIICDFNGALSRGMSVSQISGVVCVVSVALRLPAAYRSGTGSGRERGGGE